MNIPISRRHARTRRSRVLLAGVTGTALGLGLLAGGVPAASAAEDLALASFVDPTAKLTGPAHVELGHQVYVGPFAELTAATKSPIHIGDESNVQDNVRVQASVRAARRTGRPSHGWA